MDITIISCSGGECEGGVEMSDGGLDQNGGSTALGLKGGTNK